jgi:hypothetical protein
MATNYGLLEGMAGGIREGLLAYQTTQKIKRDNQMSNLLHGVQEDESGNLQFTPQQQELNEAKNKGLIAQYSAPARNQKIQDLTQGIQEEPGGEVSFTPEMQQQRSLKQQADVASSKSAIGEHDPNSPESQSMRNYAKSLGLKVDNTMSASQMREMLPLGVQKIKGDELLAVAGLKNQTGANKTDQKDLQHDQDKLFADKDYVSANSGIAAGNKLRTLLEQNNPIEANMAPVFMARAAVGGGRLNQQEIQAAGGSKAIQDRINQAIAQATSGKLSPENQQFMLQMLDKADEADRANLASTVDRYAQRRAHNKGTDTDIEYENLTGSKRAAPAQGLLSGKAGAKAPPPGMSFQEFQQWKRQNGQ